MIPSLILSKLQVLYGEALELPSHINRLLPAKEGWQGSEHDLQTKFFKYLAQLRLEDPFLHLAHSIPNTAKRTLVEGAMMVAEGMKSGIPDVFIPLPRKKQKWNTHDEMMYHGMYIEFKRAGLKPSDEQRAMCLMLDSQGYKVIVTNSYEIAVEEFNKYYGV